MNSYISKDDCCEDVNLKKNKKRRVCKPDKVIPVVSDGLICNHQKFVVGSLVWGKIPGSRIWPGIVIEYSDCGMPIPSANKIWVFWFGDRRISLARKAKTYDFTTNFVKFFNFGSAPASFKRGVFDILLECRKRAGLPYSKERTELKSYLSWACEGFPTSMQSHDIFKPIKGMALPDVVLKELAIIKSHQECENSNKINFLDEFPTESSSSDSDSDSEVRKMWRPKAAALKKIRKGEGSLTLVCIGCEKINEQTLFPHPIFEGGLCPDCKVTYDNHSSQSGIDGVNYHCAICCSPGEVFLCDNEFCDKVFCHGCIELFIAPSAVEKIKKSDPWFCFLCTTYDFKTHGLLIPKPEFLSQNLKEKEIDLIDFYEEDYPEGEIFKRPLRVLSLFDGIGSGLFVLDKLKLKINCYFASEIDQNAINVAKMNFGDRIEHVGDVQMLSNKEIEDLCPIDLLIGGSPCNDLSFVNPNRKGLYDPTGTGILFFHFFRIQKVIEKCNGKERRLFWFYENVSSMSKEYKAQICLFLQRNPIMIDAKLFSSQKRPRYYWGNLPGMYRKLPEEKTSQKHSLNDSVIKECNRKANVEVLNCVTTNSNSLLLSKGIDYPIIMNGQPDVPWITELEKVFGFPAHYTDVGNLGVRERQTLLGKAWSVETVTHLFCGLTQYFLCTNDEDQETNSEKDEIVGKMEETSK